LINDWDEPPQVPEPGRTLEQGSGFIVSADGKIVTNYHVIAGADSAIVKLSDGGIYGVEGIVGAPTRKKTLPFSR
jgi:S1-C subfamily serine protease